MDSPKIQAIPTKLSLNCRGRLVSLSTPAVMGIINITPDSFFAGSRNQADEHLLLQAGQMLNNGATFLDLGGYSTRPGAEEVSIQEEIDRVVPAIALITKHLPQALVSVDTFRAPVAEAAVSAGAVIVNDISSGEDDENMLPLVGRLNTPYIMMHKRGTPKTMQQFAQYEDVTNDLLDYFAQRIQPAQQQGIKDIILDPGFGFAKTLQHNYALLQHLKSFEITGLPVLAGVSRKKMIQQITGTDAAGALNGTSVVHTIALLNGARILRAHDVKEAMECINIVKATYGDI